MAVYVITYGNSVSFLPGGDIISASSLSAAKRTATRMAHDWYDINIWCENQVSRLARRRYIGGGRWAAWENC